MIGIENHRYPISKASVKVKNKLYLKNYYDLEKFKKNQFDLIIAFNSIYMQNLGDIIKTLTGISRISKYSYISLASFEKKIDRDKFFDWTLLGTTILKKDDWKNYLSKLILEGIIISLRLKLGLKMQIKVSEYISICFQRKVLNIFRITGGGAMHLNDSFGKNKNLKFVFFHHEQAASMAAESYFRVNSLPCILHTTSGPGGTNAITGVTGAWIDSIPMFVISGQVPTQDMINNTKTIQIGLQEINIIDIVRPTTKYSHVLKIPKR